jgi:hypothetical protein
MTKNFTAVYLILLISLIPTAWSQIPEGAFIRTDGKIYHRICETFYWQAARRISGQWRRLEDRQYNCAFIDPSAVKYGPSGIISHPTLPDDFEMASIQAELEIADPFARLNFDGDSDLGRRIRQSRSPGRLKVVGNAKVEAAQFRAWIADSSREYVKATVCESGMINETFRALGRLSAGCETHFMSNLEYRRRLTSRSRTTVQDSRVSSGNRNNARSSNRELPSGDNQGAHLLK